MKHYVAAKEYRRIPFSVHFENLFSFKCKYERHPGKQDDPVLWEWMSELRNKYKKGNLSKNWIAELNDLGFKWTSKEAKWFDYGKKIIKYLRTHNKVPTCNQQMKIYYWVKDANDRLRNNTLSPDAKEMVEDINDYLQVIRSSCGKPIHRSTNARDARWTSNLQELTRFRRKLPGYWPSHESIIEKERQLARWCKELRLRQRNNMLEREWIDKLKEIGFRFDKASGKRITLFQTKRI